MTTLLEISEHAFTDETQTVTELLEHTEPFRDNKDAIFDRATGYVKNIRDEEESSFQQLMAHYHLGTEEGIALMCLAEALLRIPDKDTAEALIEDKLSGRHWSEFFSKDESMFVNASTFGLLLGESVVTADESRNAVGKMVGKFITRLGEPVVREALRKGMALLGRTFVLGETIENALKKAKKYTDKGYIFSFDMLGEGARTDKHAQIFYDRYMHAINAIGKWSDAEAVWDRPGISIKLSALHPSYEYVKKDELLEELYPRIKSLALAAHKNQLGLAIDAEEARRLDISLVLFQALLEDPDLKELDALGFVLQAYQKRAIPTLEFLKKLALKRGKRIPIRLVKGAYWDTEIKYAQELGLPGYPVFTRKSHTDISYLACANMMLNNREAFYPQFASHNALTVASIKETAPHDDYEFQRLFGMGDTFYDPIVKEDPVRVYAPVGTYEELLPYLIRRLLENGANNSFVNLAINDDEPIHHLLSSPLERVVETHASPREDIPLPKYILGERENSSGIDWGNAAQVQEYEEEVNRAIEAGYDTPKENSPDDATKAVDRTHAFFETWNYTPVGERTKYLERAADLVSEYRYELCAILTHEAGKLASDAILEIRETIDFLRYYSLKAHHIMEPIELPSPTGETDHLIHTGKGVFVCISPWNFPLAIFSGQIAAALATGNTVVAKPAEQTPAIAKRMVEILYEAGIPEDALQLLIGAGEIGAALTKDPRISGVCFTGSTATAKAIDRTLAERDGPIATLIAETGGQNAFVIDSSALLETAIDDVVLSAFGSAGQRCSAARIALVQDSILEPFTDMLKGAMANLVVDDPQKLATDVGPIIDEEAYVRLAKHCEEMENKAKLIAKQEPTGKDHSKPHLAPHAFLLDSLDDLKEEQFGPILHVIPFDDDDIRKVIDDVNNLGYGLTFGIHSRINERIALFKRYIRAGNIYVNRSITGAVVGVQPFGGMNLSGTGPKAGGPHYLHAFCHEQTISDNITAIGGNLELINATEAG